MDNREKDLLMLRAVEHTKKYEYVAALRVINQILDEEPGDHITLFNKAFTLRIAGQINEAEDVFSDLLDLMPDSVEVHHQIGLLLSGKGESERALSHFIRETEIQPLCGEAWCHVGSILLTLERFDEAKTSLRKGSVFAPDNADIWISLGLCNLKERNLSEAIRCFDHALEIEPGAEQVLYHKARIFDALGDRDKEIACYDDLLKKHPENVLAWLKKGLALMMNEEYDLSLSCFSLASRLEEPGHMPFLMKGLVLLVLNRVQEAIVYLKEAFLRSPEDPDISLHLGRALGSAGHPEEALAAFERVLKWKPGNPEATEGKARALYHLQRWEELCNVCSCYRENNPGDLIGYLLEARVRGWHTGEYDSALSIIQEGLTRIPGDEHLLCLHADLLGEMAQTNKALEVLTSGLQRDTDSVPVLYRLGMLETQLGKYEVASQYFDHIIRIRPEDAETLYLAGETYEQGGDPETALKRYTSAVTHSPLDPKGWLGRARTLMETGNAHEALISAMQATSLSDDSYDAWFCQGRAEIEAGMLENARKTFTWITMSRPESPEGWRCLGDVMLRLKEGSASCIAYTRALSIDSSDHNARDGKIKSLLLIQDRESAKIEYDIALALKGDNFRDLYGKGMVLMDINRIDEARVCFERSLLYADHDAEALFCLANAWATLNEYSLSDQLYQRSLESDPDNNNVWSKRGDVLRHTGNHAEAVTCFDRALELNPEDAESFKAREDCKKALTGRDFFSGKQ